jgi:hypothetical protein
MVIGVVGGGDGDLTGYGSGIKEMSLWSAEESRVIDWVWSWGGLREASGLPGLAISFVVLLFALPAVVLHFRSSPIVVYGLLSCFWIYHWHCRILLYMYGSGGDGLVLWAGHPDQTGRHRWSDCWAEGYLAGHHFASFRFVSLLLFICHFRLHTIPLGWLRDHKQAS